MPGPTAINRRDAIRRVGALLGGVAFTGGSGLLAAAEAAAGRERPAAGAAVGDFSAADIALLDEIAETILPATKTPGAKAAQTGAFMALMVTDGYRPHEQDIFRAGLRKVDEAARAAAGVPFMQATPAQRLQVLTVLDGEQKRVMDVLESSHSDLPAHYFRMMKELALLGYFTSEIGCTQALRYMETPGRFDPCMPYTAGDPAWAAHA